ncbi:MAG: prepilin-type N-terminal cleavage/methylation domain-containing protein [Methylotenera sp.]|nr:prepilin-type N-terminal cleavage/methylation domain-containing protein [Methylotenera sp.]
MKKQQAGFTLIELAIVLVIIGLLLGGVLKGQELINSAKVKNMVSDFQNTQIFLYGYQGKFKALPGDDANVANHVTGATSATAPDFGNFKIDGAWSSTTATDESYLFWQHVRLAGLAPGSTDIAATATYVPRNADGGQIGIQSGAVITGMKGSFSVCSGNILGKLAKQIDVNMDDGDTGTGSVQAALTSAATAAVASSAVDDAQLYNVCMTF